MVQLRVLVVDDDPAVAELLEEVLARLGHEVKVVSDGPTALERAASASYDAMVLDVRMPRMSGTDVFEALRAYGSPLVERTVFICADLNPEVRAAIARLGRPVIGKPFRLDRAERRPPGAGRRERR